jgi:streptogramin lyase
MLPTLRALWHISSRPFVDSLEGAKSNYSKSTHHILLDKYREMPIEVPATFSTSTENINRRGVVRKVGRGFTGHGRRSLVFAALFLASSAGPIITSSGAEAQEAPNSALPSDAEVVEGLQRIEKEEAEREVELAGPAAVQERQESEHAYAEASPVEAIQLLQAQFPEQLSLINSDPARFLSDATLTQPLGDGTAGQVVSEGSAELLDASIPVLALEADGDLGKVNLTLTEGADGFQPTNPLTDVFIPLSAAEDIEVGVDGIGITAIGADGESEAMPFGEKNIFYADTQTDTDVMVSPVAGGVEISNQLRSVNSPETFRFDVTLPPASELRSDSSGGAEIARGSEILARVFFPTAVDAQGTPVPVELEVEGPTTLVIHIPHHNQDFAYPILLDPTLVEDWYNASWWGGSNLSALTDANWPWAGNAGWIYHDFKCIWTCWGGSNRGLFISAESGNHAGGEYVQYSYTPPGSTSYITSALLNPFWRNNYNCPKSSYPQPHDYDGLWQPSGWAPLETNRANDFGNAQPSGGGRALVIGLGQGTSWSENKCRRDIMVGGVAVWITDPDVPSLSKPTVQDDWISSISSINSVSVSASDAGLGMKYFRMFTTNPDGTPAAQNGFAIHSCTGLRSNPCPSSWSTQINNYGLSSLPDGISGMVLKAYDALGDEHYSQGQPLFLKVDRSGPAISWSGPLLEEKPKSYRLDVTGTDGNSGSLATARSGMKSFTFYFDGVLLGRWPDTTSPPPCTNVQQGMDLGSCEFRNVRLDLYRALSGQHTLKVVAADSANNVSEKSLELNLPKDVTGPTLTPSGALYEAANRWIAANESTVSIQASDSETGIVEAFLRIDGKQVGASATQECFYGGCGLSKTFAAPLSGYSDGPHTVAVVAKDAAGNIGESSWTIKRDGTRPNLSLNTSEVPTGWTPQLSSVNFGYNATDSGSGVRRIQVIEPLAVPNGLEPPEYSASCTTTQCPSVFQGSGSVFPSEMTQGEAQVLVKAYDGAGNVSSTRILAVNVDRTAPQVSASGPLMSAAVSDVVGLSSELGMKIQDYGGGVSSVDLLLDGVLQRTVTLGEIIEGGGSQFCGGEACNLSYEFPAVVGEGMTPGPHTFSIVARDKAQHSTTISHEVTLDTRAPEVDLEGTLVDAVGEFLPGTTASLAATVDDGEESSGIADIDIEVDGVPVEPKADLWVVDRLNNRVEAFTAKGQYVSAFGSYGSGAGQLKGPSAIATDVEGNLWVTDSGNHRVQKFNQNGEYLYQFGSYGSGNGQFSSPAGIAVGPNGWIYVIDQGNHRIESFTKDGTYLGQKGSYGWNDAQFDEPKGVAIGGPADGKAFTVLVVDSGNDRVQRFGPLGEFLGKFGSPGSGPGQLNGPMSLEVDPVGNIWVSDLYNARIQEFSSDGEYMTQFGGPGTEEGQFTWPVGMAINAKGDMWVTDMNNNRVQRWAIRKYQLSSYLNAFASPGQPGDVAADTQGNLWVASAVGNQLRKYDRKGQLLATYGSAGTGNGQFGTPSALALDAQGNIWVADRQNNRIQKFNPQGEFLLKFGSYGAGNGQFNGPEGIAIDRHGNVWVSDTYNRRVQKFNPQGQFLKVAVPTGFDPGQVRTPVGIDVAPNGEIWIADWARARVTVVDEEGKLVRLVGMYGRDPGEFLNPDGIEVDAHGNVWVGDSALERVQQFESNGNYVAQFGTAGSGQGQFNFAYPMGLDTDSKGNLWIADSENNRIQKWVVSVDEPSYSTSLGSLGTGSGQLNKPVDVTLAAGASCEPGICPQLASEDFSYSEAAWGSGPHSVVVTATDAAGNTNSEEVRVNEPLKVDAPICPSAEVKVLSGGQALSSSSATSAIKAAVPNAVEPNDPYEEEGAESASDVELEPGVTQAPLGVSLNNMGIDVRQSMMGGGIENESGGSFTVGQAHCLQPLQNGSAATSPAIVEGAAVVYPNTAPDTDTILRPTAFGTTIIQHLRGPNAPTTFSWAVGLENNQELVALKNGGVAVVLKGGPDLKPEDAPPPPPGGTAALSSTNAQVAQAERDLVLANNEIEGEVSMVIAAPEVVTSSGQVVPGALRISGGSVVKAELPPNTVAEAEALIVRANPAAEPESMCAAVVAIHPEYSQAVCGEEEIGEEPEEPEEVEDLQSLANTPNSSLNTTLLSLIARYDSLWSLGGAQASSGSIGGLTKSQKEFCEPERRKVECRSFLLDGLIAAEAENVLWNIPEGSNGTRANAFRHTFWVALMGESETEHNHGLAWAIAHEENQWKSAKARIARESKMDILNNFVGNVRAGGSALSSCELMLDKSIHATYITAARNPFKWANNNGYEYYRPVYRKLVDNARSGASGQVVLSAGLKCKDVW